MKVSAILLAICKRHSKNEHEQNPTNIQEINEFERNDDGTEHQMVEEHESTTYSARDEQGTGNEQE